MFDKCPGAANIKTPTLKIRRCPECGDEIEVFSNDFSAKCKGCGFTIYEDIDSCIKWCKYANKCVGEEFLKRYKNKDREKSK